MLDVWKSFRPGMDVLKGVSFHIPRGGLVVLEGRTGAGKSTLLRTVMGMERPDSGRILVGGIEVSDSTGSTLAQVRRSMGLMIQGIPLLPRLTVAENVNVVLRAGNVPIRERRFRIYEVLKAVGLERRRDAFPRHLSGGETQQVCLARALVGRPAVLLADEPTALLDEAGSAAVVATLREAHEKGVTLFVATQDPALAGRLSARRLSLVEGRVHEMGLQAEHR